MYDAVVDPYCYPGTTVLINKLNLRYQKQLDAFEAEITMQLVTSLENLVGRKEGARSSNVSAAMQSDMPQMPQAPSGHIVDMASSGRRRSMPSSAHDAEKRIPLKETGTFGRF